MPKKSVQATSRPRLSNKVARALFLERHGLARRSSQPPHGGSLESKINTLGFVQVDSINTVERAHHMILAARSKPYRPSHLKLLLERDRVLFEHWTHDAAVIPTQFYPYWAMRFVRDSRKLRARWRNWRRDGFEEKFDEVLNHIRENGPTMARDVGDGEARSGGGWWDWHPSKTALEFLWRTGKLAVSRREGFQKVFDLTERVIPAEHLDHAPTEAETIEWACSSALDRLGFATSGELAAFWDTITPAEARTWCQQQRGGDLVEIEIDCADAEGRRTVFARPDILDQASDLPNVPSSVRILSPFDPLLRDRTRAERLFGFHYRIEVFVPAAKRVYGYYVFPVLERDRMIGRINMKRDAATSALIVTAFWPEKTVRMGKARLSKLIGEIERMARFAGCRDVKFQTGWLIS